MSASRYNVIETPRLTLRPASEADVVALVPAIGNYDVARWLGRVPYPYRREEAEAFVAANAGKVGRTWLIHTGSDLVGGISVDEELGFWIRRDRWGEGYAVEAAVAAVEAHFADNGAGELRSGHFVGNDRSRRVLEKLGFEHVGAQTVPALALGQEVESWIYRLTRAAWVLRRPRLSVPVVSVTAKRAGGRS